MENVFEKNLLIEGKTKKIYQTETPEYVMVQSKDDITAQDGAKHDVILGKSEFSTTTTSNVFRLLKKCGIPVAFIEKIGQSKFLAEKCDMIPYEVVIRREAHGSFLKRHPELTKGHIFPSLIVEFFLKTSQKKWKNIDLLKDDPLIHFGASIASLYLPDQPVHQQKPFNELTDLPFQGSETLKEIKKISVTTFLVLEKSWQLIDKKLVDLKIEFGINKKGELKIADVIDNDSWRLLDNEEYIDKQLYRDGVALEKVAASYKSVSEMTANFTLPRQQIILWKASKSDDLHLFEKTISEFGAQEVCEVKLVTCSAHKEPLRAFNEITQLVQAVPNTVVIAYVGKSNGLGPMLSSQTSAPVITVPASWKEFPEDIWSSLRVPSNTPVMTILEPKNAVLAALSILAMSNPKLYAQIQCKKEELMPM